MTVIGGQTAISHIFDTEPPILQTKASLSGDWLTDPQLRLVRAVAASDEPSEKERRPGAEPS